MTINSQGVNSQFSIVTKNRPKITNTKQNKVVFVEPRGGRGFSGHIHNFVAPSFAMSFCFKTFGERYFVPTDDCKKIQPRIFYWLVRRKNVNFLRICKGAGPPPLQVLRRKFVFFGGGGVERGGKLKVRSQTNYFSVNLRFRVFCVL